MAEGDQAPKMIAEADVAQMIAAAVAKAGQEAEAKVAAARTALDKDRALFEANQVKWQQERDAQEEAALKADPDAFQALRQRRQLERRETEIQRKAEEQAARDAAFKEREAAVTIAAREALASRVASETNVALGSLLKWGGNTETSLREFAALLPKQSQSSGGTAPDSGRSSAPPNDVHLRDAFIADPYNPQVSKAYMERRRAKGL